jgi:hypothetical protein
MAKVSVKSMSQRLWRVTKIALTEDARRFGVENAVYAYHIQGDHLERGDTFSWTIPASDLANPSYDLSGVMAKIEEIAGTACAGKRSQPTGKGEPPDCGARSL